MFEGDYYYYDDEDFEDSDLLEEREYEAPRAPLSYNYYDDFDEDEEGRLYDDEY